MDKRAALYTAADRRPTDQVSAWQIEQEIRPTRLHPRKDPRNDVGVSRVLANM